MTSGIGKPSRLPLLAALLLGTSAGADDVARHRAWDLNALLTALAARTEGSARFSETRTLNLVTTPIRSSGRLYYRRPDILEKHVLSPREERLRIDGDRLTIEDGSPDSPRSVHLPDHPALLAAIESIRAPLTGDAPTLQRVFQATLGGSERRWVLALAPRAPAYAGVVRTVYVRGSGIRIASIEIQEANGDRSVITLEPER